MSLRSPVFTGVCTALVTPFTDTGGLHTRKLEELIEQQISRGVDALCVCGTTGESATLSPQEQDTLIRLACKRVNGRVPVLAGTGSNDTKKAVLLSKQAQDNGADALLVVTPYYNKTTQAGLISHYQTIAREVELPIVVYNVPGRTGLSFTAESYRILAMDTQFNGVKEASGDLGLAAKTLRLCGPDFFLWSGNDEQTVPLMALGAVGTISVASNLIPEEMARLTHLCLKQEFREAARLQLSLLPLLDALFSEVNPIPVKTAMELLGMETGPLRPPLFPMEEGHRKALTDTLRDLGLSA